MLRKSRLVVWMGLIARRNRKQLNNRRLSMNWLTGTQFSTQKNCYLNSWKFDQFPVVVYAANATKRFSAPYFKMSTIYFQSDAMKEQN